jgi:hypothetical protein
MTEEVWLPCSEPSGMLEWLCTERQVSERKLRLFACAVCYRIHKLLIDSNSLRTVQVTEAFADGDATDDELRSAADATVSSWEALEFSTAFDEARRYAVAAMAHAAGTVRPAHWALVSATRAVELRGTAESVVPSFAELLRDIFGNPFRSVELDPRWLASAVLDLARTIYEERCFERMPILADALMDAGCDDEVILGHCRGSGPHTHGCWLIDLILGKS